MATWHSNYCDYLQYYFLETLLKPGFLRYLQGFYEQMPVVYVPVSIFQTLTFNYLFYMIDPIYKGKNGDRRFWKMF